MGTHASSDQREVSCDIASKSALRGQQSRTAVVAAWKSRLLETHFMHRGQLNGSSYTALGKVYNDTTLPNNKGGYKKILHLGGAAKKLGPLLYRKHCEMNEPLTENQILDVENNRLKMPSLNAEETALLSMDDIELKNIQLQFPSARRFSGEGGCVEIRVRTDRCDIQVAVQGDRSKPAIITYHDIGMNSHVCAQALVQAPTSSSFDVACYDSQAQPCLTSERCLFLHKSKALRAWEVVSPHICFQTFFNYVDMRALLENFCVYHINAPGQEEGAPSLPEDDLSFYHMIEGAPLLCFEILVTPHHSDLCWVLDDTSHSSSLISKEESMLTYLLAEPSAAELYFCSMEK
ncbi:Protein NDRG3 [Papilio machaon]|uniref:Protein NDRG3 n=1 Tax=Papilio machaon TaxID=76193 RepID=A0A194QUQ2_PAPMA|nr:Protein NDRG3 [Papilio machaon]